jgi:predicted dehydrogenase
MAAYDRSCYTFFGTGGCVSFPQMECVHTSAPEDSWHTPLAIENSDVGPSDPLQRELCHFLNVIRGTEEPVISGESAYSTLKVAFAIRQSAIEHRQLSLDVAPQPAAASAKPSIAQERVHAT